MFRKVVIGNCTLIKGNCENVMEELESNSIKSFNISARSNSLLVIKYEDMLELWLQIYFSARII